MSGRGALVLAFPHYAAPARRLARAAGLRCAELDVHTFPDGESRVRVPQPVPAEVVLCTSLDQANRRLVELELAAATALELGAEHLTLIAPYLCYMRQDTAFAPGEAVSQRIIGALLARRFDTVITVDAHLHRTHALADAVPVRRAVNLSAAAALSAWLAAQPAADGKPLVLGPDAESAQWVEAIARRGALEHGVAHKRRFGDRDVAVELPTLAYAGREVVLVDDVASTGRTLAAAARAVKARGAAAITVLVTHALFVGDALAELAAAGVTRIASSDSIVHDTNQVELAGLLAAALIDA